MIASVGDLAGQVRDPVSVAVDGSGKLYVAEYQGQRVQRRDPAGRWTVVAEYGDGAGQVRGPRSVAVDGEGNLYVLEYDAERLQVWDR